MAFDSSQNLRQNTFSKSNTKIAAVDTTKKMEALELTSTQETLSLTDNLEKMAVTTTQEDPLALSSSQFFKLRSDKHLMVPSPAACQSLPDSSDEEETEELLQETRRELSARSRNNRRLTRSVSADLVILRSADSPFDNRFLFVHAGPRGGDLGLQLGFVDPHAEGGKGVFKRWKKVDERSMTMQYCYTNIRFHRTVAVQGGQTPRVALMEPPQSPVSCSDPRMFRKVRAPYHSFRLQSSALKDCSLTYDAGGSVSLSKAGSPFTEREGTAADEVDSGKQLGELRGNSLEAVEGEKVVLEYGQRHPHSMATIINAT